MKKLNSHILAPVIVALFFGGILASMAMNLWVTESSKVAMKYSQGEYAGQANPADIRGSYSLADIEANFGIPVAVTARAFGAADWANPGDFKAKDLETMYEPAPNGEIGTDSVRLFVARYLGLPYAPEDTTLLPPAALEELKSKLAPADLKALREYAYPADMMSADPTSAVPGQAAVESTAAPAAEPAPAPKAESATGDHAVAADEDRTIKGKTTFYDLLSWGVTKATIEKIMGMEIGATSVAVRDFCAEKGLEFSEYKTALQAAVPAAR